MEIRPILSALLRNSAGAILVSLQIAITLAIVVNAVYLVKQRVDTVSRPTGMDEYNMFSVRVTGFGKDFNFHNMVREDKDLLRRVPLERFGNNKVEEGMQFQAGEHGIFTVREVADGHALLDGNHPLAGVTLNFEVEITDVREATADEIAHGHVHGPGGHHH